MEKLSEEKIYKNIEILSKEFPSFKRLFDYKIHVNICNDNSLTFSNSNKKISINAAEPHYIYKFLSFFLNNCNEESGSCKFNVNDIELTYMADFSRNNVMNIKTIKQFILYLAVLGYKSFMLYMEDTYTISGEPYFGHFRGRFSKEELKEIDSFSDDFNIECIPAIQTLAHLNGLNNWCVYNREFFDINDILLVDDEKVCSLIDKMISNISECFISNKINIGMDEAFALGRGKFLDKYGYHKRKEIFLKHLKTVSSICKKYNKKVMMWSDMFFSSLLYAYQNGNNSDLKIDFDLQDTNLIYWDYEVRKPSETQKYLKMHYELTNNISFAGGTWKWIGFAPNNRYSIQHISNSMKACIKENVKDYILTGWGDNGGETSVFTTLPSLNVASNIKYFGIFNADYGFSNLSNIDFKRFLDVDRLNQVTKSMRDFQKNSLNRTFLYNDVLCGVFDSVIKQEQSKIYKSVANSLKKNIKDEKFGYLFNTIYLLAEVLSLKTDIAFNLRNEYKNKDIDKIKMRLKQFKTLLKKIDLFADAFYFQRNKESKPFGYDVFDLRIGGLKQRINTAILKLSSFIDDNENIIPELEVDQLDFYGNDKEYFKADDLCEYRYKRMSTVNVND